MPAATAMLPPDPQASPGSLPPEMFSPGGMFAIADLLPVMCAYVDRDLKYCFLNKPYADWLEKPRGEILGRTLREIIGEAAFAARKPLIEAALAGERKFFATDFDHETRGPVALQIDYVPWTVPGAEAVQGLIVLLTDVTEQRAAERALRESEERFRRIANSAPVLMWVTRRDRVRDFVNDTYAEFIGLPHEEACRHDWR